MISKLNHQSFDAARRSQPLRNDRCQTILYKAVFEHFVLPQWIAALLLTSKSFQNSSFGANFLVNYIVDENSIDLIESVLSPSSCFSVQFTPSIHITQSKMADSGKVNRSIANFVGEIVASKYFPLSLRSLSLDTVTNQVLSFFFESSNSNSWPQLHELTLEKCDVEDDTLEIISTNAPQLRTVNLLENSWITDAGLEHIAKFPNIASLAVSRTDTITDVGIEHLAALTSITSLDLSFCNQINDECLRHISKLSSITSLNLFYGLMITDVGLEYIAEMPHITSLDLSYCDMITDAGLKQISKLSGITYLTLTCCSKIEDEGIKHISKLSRLASLDLSCCIEITDAGLEHISKLADITSLNLSKCRMITDVGLEHISKLSRITSLDLRGCYQLTDSCVQHVSKFSRITSLDLSFCDRITTEAKNKLKAALPHCEISVEQVFDNECTFAGFDDRFLN